jgi:hypothetical protein
MEITHQFDRTYSPNSARKFVEENFPGEEIMWLSESGELAREFSAEFACPAISRKTDGSITIWTWKA